MPKDPHLRKVECRKEVRKQLAIRPGLLFSASAIAQRCEGSFNEEEVTEALDYLLSKTHVAAQRDEDGGSTRYYQITANGTNAYEAQG